MEALGIEADLIRWTMSFMSDRQVKIILDGEVGEANSVDTGIPQGSPAAPILFATYLSGIFDEVERAVTGISGLSFVDDIGWWAEGEDDEAVATKLSAAAAASLDWGKRNGVASDHGKTEAAIFWRRKKGAEVKAKVKVGDNEIPVNKEATRLNGRVARLTTHSATSARRAAGPLPSELQEGRDGLHPVSRHVRSGAVVEGRGGPGYGR